MNVHEFQAKSLLSEYDVAIPRGDVATSADQAAEIASALGGSGWWVKAQIHAGGRGAGHIAGRPESDSGVRRAASVDEVKHSASLMLGNILVTPQTGPAGRKVSRVYVEEALPIQREIYLGMLIDRETGRVMLLASASGGMNIESIAASAPASIRKCIIDPRVGLTSNMAAELAEQLELPARPAAASVQIMLNLYRMFTSLDASLLELNPLALTEAGNLVAVGATATFDDNALFRHDDIRALRDEDELRSGELQAVTRGFNYIKLDGNIGFLTSGAGMAMATLDAIKILGGEPANFLDVPPTAEAGRIREAIDLIMSDAAVRSVLVNVFGGGIMRCDTIADGLILANRATPFRIPVVVRLAGVSATYAIHRLRDSGPDIIFADNLATAAQTVIAAAAKPKAATPRSWRDKMRDLMSGHDH